MKKMLVIGLLVASCDKTVNVAESHLRALGFKRVACEGYNLATCSADDAHFHCAVTSATGCAGDQHVACERFYEEKPSP